MPENAIKTSTEKDLRSLDPAILELLASRICHDLISPVGAVHNGVEFLEEMGAEAGADAIGLIAHSAQQAAAKLQAFRLAYGAGGRDPNIKPEDVKKTFQDLIEADGKITQDWDPHTLLDGAPPLGLCKILTGLLMIAQETLPKGGTISVKADDNIVTVTAEGENAVPRAQVKEALAQTLTLDDLDPRLVHPYAMAALARRYDMNISLQNAETGRVTYALSY